MRHGALHLINGYGMKNPHGFFMPTECSTKNCVKGRQPKKKGEAPRQWATLGALMP